ncbi:MAG TPA: alpha/beta fold hydrolase [Paucimonas sp.]|nr:alpha/beta fold hydrolase [Paucimonas sp.]
MIASITRMLLLMQAIAAVAASIWAIKLWQLDNPALAVAFGLAAVLALRAAITVNNFFLARRFRSPLPAAYRLNWLQSLLLIAQEFRATMWSSSWSMPFQRFDKHVASDPATLPVLLVHGYGCNSGYWKAMSDALRKASITHYAVDLEPVFGSIDAYAASVHDAVETLCRETGQRKIVILAHSMGGLVARAYLRDHGSIRIAKAITLGTPHHGTALARHGIGLNTEQMRWTPDGARGISSEWLRALQAGENDAVRALFVSIYSHHDNIISPQTSSHLPGARNIELHGIGHVALALHPKVQAIVIDEIKEASRTAGTQAESRVAAE